MNVTASALVIFVFGFAGTQTAGVVGVGVACGEPVETGVLEGDGLGVLGGVAEAAGEGPELVCGELVELVEGVEVDVREGIGVAEGVGVGRI